MRLKTRELLKSIIAVAILALVGNGSANAGVIYSQNFDGVTPAGSSLSIANSGPTLAHPSNVAYSFIGTANPNVANSTVAIADVGNLFGAGTSNQYLKYVDGSGDPQIGANAPLPVGTTGFQITADFYDPSTVAGTVRLGLTGAGSGAASAVFGNQTVILFFNNGDLQAFHGTISQNAVGAYALNKLNRLTVVGSYSGTQTYGSQSVAAGTYDVWVNHTKVLDNVVFRNSLTSSAGIGINNANAAVGDMYFDNIEVRNDIVTTIPEPSTSALSIGLIGLGLFRSRRTK